MALAPRCLLHGSPGEHRDAMGELCLCGGQPAAREVTPRKDSSVLMMGCPEQQHTHTHPCGAQSLQARWGQRRQGEEGKHEEMLLVAALPHCLPMSLLPEAVPARSCFSAPMSPPVLTDMLTDPIRHALCSALPCRHLLRTGHCLWASQHLQILMTI